MLTRFVERRVGGGGDQVSQFGARVIVNARGRAACVWQRVGRTALTLAAHEVADCCGTDAKQFGDLALRATPAFISRDDLTAQVVGVGFHAQHSERLLLVTSRANRSNEYGSMQR